MVYTYDVLGEQLTETGYDGAVTTTAVQGRTREVTDGNGRHFIYESDELGRLLRVRQPVTAAPNWTISYTYDLADNLLTATGPNNAVTTMTYDKLGRKLTSFSTTCGMPSVVVDRSIMFCRTRLWTSWAAIGHYEESSSGTTLLFKHWIIQVIAAIKHGTEHTMIKL